jgi:hypothetical protein
MKIGMPMNRETTAKLRAQAELIYQKAERWISRIPVKARVVLGLFLVAALLMAVHTAISAKDSSLHLRVQHGFRDAQVSVWVDGDLAFSGNITGATKKKFGLIPTDAVQGSFSQIIAVRSGQHKVRVRIQPSDSAAQEDSIAGSFSANAERSLLVSAHRGSLSLSWTGATNAPVEAASSVSWLSRYAGSLFLTFAGSIMSAVAGYVLRELPGRLRPASQAVSKVEPSQQVGSV